MEAQTNGPNARSNSGGETCRRSQSLEVPVNRSVVADLGNCVEATRDLLGRDYDSERKRSPVSAASEHHHQNRPTQTKAEGSAGQLNLMRDLEGLTSQNRRTLWLLTYVALITTFPLLGSALVVRTRGKILDVLNRRWPKRTR